MNNELIRKNLIARKESCLSVLNSINNLDSYLNKIYANLNKFDFEKYKQNLEIEIIDNLNEWWINPNKGIKKEEELFAILFEYDYFFKKNVEAAAYGIGEWKDYKIQTDKFNMGFKYDFTTEFYASPGIKLNFFNSLESIDDSNLPEEYKDNFLDGEDIEEIEGYNELIELHKLKGMIAIHDVLLKLDLNNQFESLNYKDNFMFIIDEHDSGEVYPLLIKNK